MRHYRTTIALLAIAVVGLFPSGLQAQEVTPEEAIRALASRFEALWNAHDMEPLGEIVTEDVDWVNVDGYRGHGREAIVTGHARVHAGKFKESVFTVQNIEVSLVRPDVAVVHVSWGIRGDRNDDGTARQPREGLFTWITVKDGDTWRIRASHNSNKGVIR